MDKYWNLTLQEIKDAIDSYRRVQEKKKKERIEELFLLAEVTANRIGYGFNSKRSTSDLIQPWHAYPTLFENLDEDLEEQQEALELEKYKARMNSHVEAWNRRFREERNNGS